MPVFNYPKKEVNVKVVYYGPGLSGKTTNLQMIHDSIKPEFKGKLVSLATQTDRTLFFDFMPLDLGSLGGYKIRLHLYTVPGQVHYNATRKLVLKGVDGVVFVADSQKAMVDANLESILNLEKNLQSYGKSLMELPHVIQANKRDLEDVMSMEEIDATLNQHGAVMTEAVASSGDGVTQTLTEIVRIVMRGLREHFVQGAGDKLTKGPRAVRPDRAVQEGPAGEEQTPDPEPPADKGQGDAPRSIAEEPAGTKAVSDESEESEPAHFEADMNEVVIEDTPGAEPVSLDEGVPDTGFPLKVRVPLDGIGTVELSIIISARLLTQEQDRDIQISGARVSVPEQQPFTGETGNGTSSTLSEEPLEDFQEIEGAPANEEERTEVLQEDESPSPPEKELSPLGEPSDEPLGAPLDGQEDEYGPRQVPLEEVGEPREDDVTSSDETPAADPGSGYDPLVKPVEFDFSGETKEGDEPRKKGFLGRFKKK